MVKLEMNPSRMTRLARTLCLLAVLAAGLMVVLGWVGGGWWLLDLLNHFQVQFTWFLGLCAVLLLLMKSPRLALVATLLMILPLLRAAPAFAKPSPAGSGNSNKVRVASFNVLMINRDHEATIRWTRETSPDAVFFTEVDNIWLKALHALDDAYPHVVEDGSGVALYSKFPVLSSRIRFCSAGDDNPLLIARVQTPGGELTVYAGHPDPPFSARRMKIHAEFTAALTEELTGKAGERVLVMGDMNCTRWSRASRPFDYMGLRDAAQGFSPGPTWRRRNPLCGIPIDRIFYRGPGMDCRSFAIGPDLGSDHRPLLAEITW